VVQADGAAFGNDDAVGSRTFGGAKYCPEISRILDPVQNYDQRRYACTIDYFLRANVIGGRSKCQHALMICLRIEQLRKCLTRHAVPGDRSRTAKIGYLREAMFLYTVGDEDLVDAASLGTQGFKYRKNAVNEGRGTRGQRRGF